MRRFASKFSKWLRPNSLLARQNLARRSSRRLELEVLEDRSVPSGNAPGVVSGMAFVDSNVNGAFDSIEMTLPGMNVSLTGTTSNGTSVSTTTTTNAGGAFSFSNVAPGTYQLSAPTGSGFLAGGPFFGNTQGPEGSDLISGITVALGQTVHQNVGFRGLAPTLITMRMFLSTSTAADIPLPAGGNGTGSANYHIPGLGTAIADVSLDKNSGQTTINLIPHFTDSSADVTDTVVRIDTSDGPINVELFDSKAPQTVANFLDYALSGAYNNSIFHRLATGFVLQGGGFTFDAAAKTIDTIPTNPSVQNEFGTSNTQGTLAMALVGSDINSATDEFFFNLVDNSSSLDPQKFAVFGKIVGPADQTVLNQLTDTSGATKITNESSTNSAFNTIPLVNYSGTNFPTDTNAGNFLLVENIAIVKRDPLLTYSVVSNDNPSLVAASIDPTNALVDLQPSTGQTGTANITVRATDPYGASVDASFKVTVNEQKPTATVSLSPSSPLSTDSLTATATASDPDHDPVTLTYVWQINGQTVKTTSSTASLTDTLDLTGQANPGNTVKVTVTPNDGAVDGTAVSNTATVATPSAGTVTLTPSDPKTTDTLTATLTGSNAHNFNYQWSVNGVVAQTHPSTSLTDTFTQPLQTGDQVSVQVTPSDGTNNGPPANSATTVNIPQASGLTLAPTSPGVTDKVTATVAAVSDPNGDPITLTYQWQVNGTIVQTTSNTSSLIDTLDLSTVANVASGNAVTVQVTPSNGSINGGAVSTSVTVH